MTTERLEEAKQYVAARSPFPTEMSERQRTCEWLRDLIAEVERLRVENECLWTEKAQREHTFIESTSGHRDF